MTTTNWIELPKLVEYLYCSERTVYKLKKANVFVAGEHFYRVGEGKEKGKCVYGLLSPNRNRVEEGIHQLPKWVLSRVNEWVISGPKFTIGKRLRNWTHFYNFLIGQMG